MLKVSSLLVVISVSACLIAWFGGRLYQINHDNAAPAVVVTAEDKNARIEGVNCAMTVNGYDVRWYEDGAVCHASVPKVKR